MTTPSHPHARLHERVKVMIPVRLEGQTGFTRDISVGGCYLQLDDIILQDGEVSFELDLGAAYRAMKIRCCGQVVRVDHMGYLTGIAIKIKGLQLLVK